MDLLLCALNGSGAHTYAMLANRSVRAEVAVELRDLKERYNGFTPGLAVVQVWGCLTLHNTFYGCLALGQGWKKRAGVSENTFTSDIATIPRRACHGIKPFQWASLGKYTKP